MDLNDALHTCRCGGHIRDDSTMRVGWKIEFVPNKSAANMRLPPSVRLGNFLYINPKPGKEGYEVRFSDKQKASIQWRTVI